MYVAEGEGAGSEGGGGGGGRQGRLCLNMSCLQTNVCICMLACSCFLLSSKMKTE